MSSKSAGWVALRAAAMAAGLLACGGGGEDTDADTVAEVEAEGDAAGECTDGSDNDQDSWLDCDDSDCAGAPDCAIDPACQGPIDRIKAFYETCDMTFPTPPVECTDAAVTQLTCAAECSEEGGCGSIDGTDAAAAAAWSDCLVACTTIDTTTPHDSDTGSGLPTVKGVYIFGLFGYDPADDVARSYFTNGRETDVSLGFMFFDENYATSGAVADSCTIFVSAAQAPRASWAGDDSGYLFGFDIDPATAGVASNCDSHYGSGATDQLFRDIINTGIWSVGLTTTVEAGTATALEGAGRNPSSYLGVTFTTTSDALGTDRWFGYTYNTVVDANWDTSPGGAAPSYLNGEQAVQARSNPSIPTTQTPVRAVYDAESPSHWLFP